MVLMENICLVILVASVGGGALTSSTTAEVKAPEGAQTPDVSLVEEIPLSSPSTKELSNKEPVTDAPVQVEEENPSVKKNLPEEDNEFSYLRPEFEGQDILVSKDNLIPILRTVVLASTHRKNPSYEYVLKAGTKGLLKMAEKYASNNKPLQTLIQLIAKNLDTMQELSEEEEEVLGALAEEYLEKHKFKFLFPESLLLHHQEMKEFYARKSEQTEGRATQVSLDLSKLVEKITSFSSRISTGVSTTIEEYMPYLRAEKGLETIGFSAGPLAALAAAGALITAPLWFGAMSRSDENEENLYYTNRRVSTGGHPQQQLLQPPPYNADVSRPAWIEDYYGKGDENRQQPIAAVQPPPPPEYVPYPEEHLKAGEENESEVVYQFSKEDYERFNNDYNGWLQQYNSAVQQQQYNNRDYQMYYDQYRDWYAQYYSTAFGEAPQHQAYEPAPNYVVPQNYIDGMRPPPAYQLDRIETVEEELPYSPEEQFQHQPYEIRDQEFPQEDQEVFENKNSHFLVTHVDDKGMPSVPPQHFQAVPQPVETQYIEAPSQVQPPVQSQQLAQLQPPVQVQPQYIHPQLPVYNRPEVPKQVPEQNTRDIVYQLPNSQALIQDKAPKPVYVATEKPPPTTELGFKPLSGEEYVFKPKPNALNPTEPQEPVDIEEFSEPKEQSLMNNNKVYVVEEEKPVVKRQPDIRPTIEIVKLTIPKPNKYKPVVTPSSISPVTSGIFKTTPRSTLPPATTPVNSQKVASDNNNVRVVTSTSVVTSSPFVKPTEAKKIKLEDGKKKLKLNELLHAQLNVASKKSKYHLRNPQLSVNRSPAPPEIQLQEKPSVNKVLPVITTKEDAKQKSQEDELPIYALDPFYGPRLSRIDAIFHQLNLEKEGCREQVVCNIYKNPNAYTPLSDFLSRQLTVTVDQLRKPTVSDSRILRFYRYLQSARAGQDGFACASKYSECDIDTTKLTHKPIINAYKKVSLLMNKDSSV